MDVYSVFSISKRRQLTTLRPTTDKLSSFVPYTKILNFLLEARMISLLKFLSINFSVSL
jgi:hypothetical protein